MRAKEKIECTMEHGKQKKLFAQEQATVSPRPEIILSFRIYKFFTKNLEEHDSLAVSHSVGFLDSEVIWLKSAKNLVMFV